MEKSLVHKLYRFWGLLLAFGMFSGMVHAETLHLADGQTITGEVVSMDEKGIVLKQADGTYADRTPWGKLSQDDLKELQGNAKAAAFVEPFIELSQEDKIKRTEIDIKPVPRLERPARHSLIAALIASPMGLLILLILYTGNIYAAYEISVFRAQPAGLVCGVAAVIPFIGPIIFISMPTKLKKKEPDWAPPPEEYVESGAEAAIAAEQATVAAEESAHAARAAAAAALPPTKTYQRGQYTFNRRFFETQLPTFFAIARPEADKDMVLTFKTARGTHIVQRISRISANEVTLHVQKGAASEDVFIPFVEIQEVQLKHKDAKN